MRHELQLSQRNLAESLGVDFTYLSKLENGHEEPPSEETLRRLAAALKVSEDQVMAMAGKLPAELRARAGRDPEFAYLLAHLPAISRQAMNRIFRAAGIAPPRFDDPKRAG